MSKWTLFWDMHSGGSQKEPWAKIYIEAPEAEARSIFYARFGHNPDRVTCTCCGEDYCVEEYESLEQATAFHRRCDYVHYLPDGAECSMEEALRFGIKECTGRYVERPSTRIPGRGYQTLHEYEHSGACLVIRADEITQEQRSVTVPEQGYIWHD